MLSIAIYRSDELEWEESKAFSLLVNNYLNDSTNLGCFPKCYCY